MYTKAKISKRKKENESKENEINKTDYEQAKKQNETEKQVKQLVKTRRNCINRKKRDALVINVSEPSDVLNNRKG